MPAIELPAYGWEPRDHQIEAWQALERGVSTCVLAWHRRAGKDEIALHNGAIKAMQRVGNYWHMLPMQEQARKALWEAVNPKTGRVRWKDAFPAEIIEHVDNQGMKVTFKNNSTWQLLGSDNYNSLVGTTPVGMTFSEAALANPNAYGFFRPILLENNGWSLHISSTRGRNHFYKLFKTYENQPDAFVQRLSAHDTAVFTAMQLAMERKVYIDLYGATLGDSLFRQEYLSEWDAAVLGAVFGKEVKRLREEGRALPLIYDARFPVDTSWDIGVGDTNVILFWQTVGNIERLIDWYSSTDTGIEHYAEILAQKRYFYHRHIGPHDISNREWGMNGVSRMSTAKKLGLNFERMPNIAQTDSIAAGARLINNMQINVLGHPVEDPMDDCAFVLEALESYHFTFDKEHRVMSKNPVHDWSSHYCSALMTRGLYTAGRTTTGRPSTLQGNGMDELQQFDKTRLSDIIASRGAPSNRGAWG
jgi:phage terminase large subunit